jgi:hypothetical protein
MAIEPESFVVMPIGPDYRRSTSPFMSPATYDIINPTCTLCARDQSLGKFTDIIRA